MNPSQPHSGGLPCSVCFSGETPSPEPEPLTGFLGALLSGAVIRVLQWRLGPRRLPAPSRAPKFGLVLRRCWVVRAGGAGPGVRGMETSRAGGGGPRPLQARSWAGSQVAGPAETRRPAPLQTSGAFTAADPGAPQPEGPVTPSLSASVQRGHSQGLLLRQLHPGLDLAGGGGPPRLVFAPTAEPVRRQPAQHLPNAIHPGVLQAVPVLASASRPLRVRSDASQEVLTLTTCLPMASGRSESRKCGGRGVALADGSCKARSSLVPQGAPESGSRLHVAQRGPLPSPLLRAPDTPSHLQGTVRFPLCRPHGVRKLRLAGLLPTRPEALLAPQPLKGSSPPGQRLCGPRSRSRPFLTEALGGQPL